MKFNLKSKFTPKGDQPTAINQLVEGLDTSKFQTLVGCTGSGKTFTIANVVEKIDRPTLVLSHNKTLAAQLYSEFKSFFPDNLVEYYISDFDYYQPEAYLPVTGKYIQKDSLTNEEIRKMRLSTISALKSGRRDILVVASVSCIFGAGNPDFFEQNILKLSNNQRLAPRQLMQKLVDIFYRRTSDDFKHGTFRVRGDQLDIHSPYKDTAYRVSFWGDEIESLSIIDPKTGRTISKEKELQLFPAELHTATHEHMNVICSQIETDLKDQIEMFEAEGQKLEAKRLKERTEFDIEMIKELGSCFGIENYSRYIDQRQPGQRPNCLLDYFPEDYLMVIDESHVTIPQIHAMYGGNYSMKKNLVEYGFRLAAAFDNRPLKFNEFEECINQAIFVSATPADYEFRQSEGVIVEQLIRPTGVVDPTIEVRPTKNQIDELIDEIDKTITNGNRVLITTLTKRMAEELDEYLRKINLNTAYIHSAVKPIDRVEIIEKLKDGTVDVLVGVNLLREGLDLPEVELVVIFDADKEGFLRNTRSMIQTIGRAARNIEGRVILFADKHTDSMKRAIDETNRRRKIQIEYNKANNIIPQTIKNKTEIKLTNKLSEKQKKQQSLKLLEDIIKNADKKELKQMISKTKKEMEEAAKNLDFLVAAKLRDEWEFLKNTLKNQK